MTKGALFRLEKFRISGQCPHCDGLTYLDSMTQTQLTRSGPALQSVLHALVCQRCGKRFGTRGGRLHKEVEE